MSKRISANYWSYVRHRRGYCRLLAKNDFKLIICGRRQDRLDALKSELAKLTDVTTLSFDVREQKEVERSIASLPAEWKNVDVLINNAGNAHGFDPIQSGKLEDWDAMMDINVKGLLYVSREIIPVMTERQSGLLSIWGLLRARKYIQVEMSIVRASLPWMH
jgi:NADP-dependent 3-hydroxy acid dehydrogenase YdfG